MPAALGMTEGRLRTRQGPDRMLKEGPAVGELTEVAFLGGTVETGRGGLKGEVSQDKRVEIFRGGVGKC